MKKNTLFFALIIIASFLPVTSQAQFGIEANYGLSGVFQPSINEISHFGGGITYDFDETYGVKLDFASDKFRTKNILFTEETGIDVTRISIQGTINLSAALTRASSYDFFNLIAHAGGGLSILKSDIPTLDKTDHIANVIMGISPQYKVAESLYLGLDASMIFNISQHYYFDGNLTYTGQANSITGIMYNVTVGLTYKFDNY